MNEWANEWADGVNVFWQRRSDSRLGSLIWLSFLWPLVQRLNSPLDEPTKDI